MKIRFIAMLILFISLPTLAADRKTATASTQRATILKMQSRGATVSCNQQQYQILPGVRAAQSRKKEKPQQTLARMGGSKLIEAKGAYVVYTAAPQGKVGVMQVNGATSYPTVLNERTGGIGIIPGSVSVKLKSEGSAAAIAADHGLVLVREFAHLQAAFYRVSPGQDVVTAVAALVADSRVVSAEMEVIEHVKVPN
jgi:hypothetical protein